MPKRGASLPPKKDSKKREDGCIICFKPADEDALGYFWCKGHQHAECCKSCKEQCEVLSGITDSVVFLCHDCFQVLPVAMKHYDREVYIDCILLID